MRSDTIFNCPNSSSSSSRSDYLNCNVVSEGIDRIVVIGNVSNKSMAGALDLHGVNECKLRCVTEIKILRSLLLGITKGHVPVQSSFCLIGWIDLLLRGRFYEKHPNRR